MGAARRSSRAQPGGADRGGAARGLAKLGPIGLRADPGRPGHLGIPLSATGRRARGTGSGARVGRAAGTGLGNARRTGRRRSWIRARRSAGLGRRPAAAARFGSPAAATCLRSAASATCLRPAARAAGRRRATRAGPELGRAGTGTGLEPSTARHPAGASRADGCTAAATGFGATRAHLGLASG